MHSEHRLVGRLFCSAAAHFPGALQRRQQPPFPVGLLHGAVALQQPHAACSPTVWAPHLTLPSSILGRHSDTCYFTAGSEKAACDQAFLDALLAECDSSLK